MLNELETIQIDEMLKKIDIMIDKHTIEKWKEIIDREMKELGLEFVPDTEFSPDVLFKEE